MTTLPLILIPVPVQDAEKRRFTLAKNYVRSLTDVGGLPIMLPVTVGERELREVYDMADGVMLTGGSDCDPAAFGEAIHHKTNGIDADRDRAEYLLTQWAVADDKPLFGICRGVQVMNVALGGSLIQDIPSQWDSELTHATQAERSAITHAVCVEPDSRIARIVGAGEVGVNSFHHQAAKRVAEGFMVGARADDGVIEAMEMPDRRFVLGVQWHPEDLSAEHENMSALFAEFVAACKDARG